MRQYTKIGNVIVINKNYNIEVNCRQGKTYHANPLNATLKGCE